MNKKNKLTIALVSNNKDDAIRVFLMLFCLLISTLFFSNIIDDQNSKWQQYNSAYIDYHFKTKTDLAIHHYAIRNNDGSFLIAGDTPDELSLNFNFTESDQLRVKVVAKYPDWICQQDAVGHAKISFSGKNINQQFSLNGSSSQEFMLKVFNSQPISIDIRNTKQKNCGRAEIYFQSAPNKSSLVLIFFIFWLALSLLILIFRQSQIFLVIGMCIHLMGVSASIGFEAISLYNLFWINGISLIVIGLLLAIRTLRIVWLRTTLWIATLAPIIWFFGGFRLYQYKTAKTLDTDAIQAVMQTHITEAWEYIITLFGIPFLSLFLIIVLGLVLIFNFLDKRLDLKKGGILGLCFVMLGASLTLQRHTDSPLIEIIDRSLSAYFFELNLFQSLKKYRQNITSLNQLDRDNSDTQVLVVVIGEAANRDHLGIYGYGRETTPFAQELIDKNQMLHFDFAYSNHTHTNQALSLALTKADQYGNEKWMSSPSIINLANTVGIQTHWVSNQQSLGTWDNHVSLIAKEANEFISKNKLTGKSKDAKENDGILIDEIRKSLTDSENSKLIFVHLQGSHASYCSKFPSDKAVYSGVTASKSVFGKLANTMSTQSNALINCYDNSIQYTDFILSEIIRLIDSDSIPSALLYFSDHSEDVIANKAHNSAVFTYDMSEIPMLFWSNENWQKANNSKWRNLTNNRQKDFTNDHIFETVSGLLGISSPQIQSKNDLSSNQYEEVDPTTLHGRSKIRAMENVAYWQRKNISKLSTTDDCTRLLPHRVNSIGKAREAIASGVCGLEIDVLIEKKNDTYIFQVGHDVNTQSNITLEDFFAKLNLKELTNIWLDIKNLNNQNIEGTLSRLDQLNSRFNLKEIALIETSFYAQETALISNQGYNVSYYLPTREVLTAMSNGSTAKENLAKIIASRVEQMNAKSVSFDLRLYSFVKDNLEPKIDIANLQYHSWFPEGLGFYTPTLLDEIAQKPFYNDSKMATILLPYYSLFSL